ncbi:hypothetical protein LC593_06425 [Nostoc sp. CHAB 5844]|nr:hypothetical protein [Nostoc sp. CHAB 5844]
MVSQCVGETALWAALPRHLLQRGEPPFGFAVARLEATVVGFPDSRATGEPEGSIVNGLMTKDK